MKILVVGGGLSGSIVCHLLRNSKANVTCWEKAKRLGGRASTKLGRKTTGQADIGLQYLTQYRNTKAHTALYNQLIADKVIKPFDIETVENCREEAKSQSHFVVTNGSICLADYFMKNSSAAVETQKRLSSIQYDEDRQKAVASTICGVDEEFDLVLVTVPVPQFLNDVSVTPKISDTLLAELQAIQYSNRFALSCFYNSNIDLGTEFVGGYTYPGAIRYWSVDNKKRDVTGGTSLLLHTMTDFHPDQTIAEAMPFLRDELKKLFPNCPEPDEIVGHKWKYSQPSRSMVNHPGFVFTHDRVALFGDGFAKQGNFDGVIDAASSITNHIMNNFEI